MDGPDKILMHESFICAPGDDPATRFINESFHLAPGDGPGKRKEGGETKEKEEREDR